VVCVESDKIQRRIVLLKYLVQSWRSISDC
jgi:hypothetical protein